MDKSVEHILLRLLTPAVLLFFASHLVAGVLDVRTERDRSAHRAHAAHYLEAGSGAAKVKRPSKVQLRKPRACEEERGCEGSRFVEAAVAYIAVMATAGGAEDDLGFCASGRRDLPPSPFLYERTRNPRDPPTLLT